MEFKRRDGPFTSPETDVPGIMQQVLLALVPAVLVDRVETEHVAEVHRRIPTGHDHHEPGGALGIRHQCSGSRQDAGAT